MDELDHRKIFNKIIFKELEPSVLNEEVIRNAVYEQGPAGEAGRLFREMEIQYEKVTILRLEFLSEFRFTFIAIVIIDSWKCLLSDILKIDHLWILPNLSILSLAFNKIDKVENLEALTNLKELNLAYNSIERLENLDNLRRLEILNVFGNKIGKIENVDCLENLIIFSAGNNLIDTRDGVSSSTIIRPTLLLNFNIKYIFSHSIRLIPARAPAISEKAAFAEFKGQRDRAERQALSPVYRGPAN
jgi:Leucine-rich repeat (LRR) protein